VKRSVFVKSIRLTQLAQDGWVFQGADVLRDFFAFGQAAQQSAHDFAGTSLR
jgi:hypothetical protein